MKKDEVRVSENFTKYMKFINSYEDGNYVAYEFEDQSGNTGIHYQIRPELLTDKRQIGLARLWNTKMAKLNKGDIAIVVCRCREILEPGYGQSVMYLNVDKIIRKLVKYKTIIKDYRGIPTEYVIEEHITNWDDIHA